MGNILPDRLFRDNRNTKSEITHLRYLIYLRNVFFKSEIRFICGNYSTTTALPTTTNAQSHTTFWTTQPVTTKTLKTLTSQSSKLMSTTPATWSPTTLRDKTVNPTEIAKNGEPLLRQVTKCDKNEGAITGLGIFAFISLIANVILSILLSRR